MTTNQITPKKSMPMVGMSQVVFLAKPEFARCIVGSCIALVLFDSRRRTGALAHIVLPKSSSTPSQPGKFADTAVEFMLDELRKQGTHSNGLTAKMFGGAAMFGPGGPLRIGEKNIEAVTQLLTDNKIPIAGKHLAGSKGRRITFDCGTGLVEIDIVGQSTQTL